MEGEVSDFDISIYFSPFYFYIIQEEENRKGRKEGIKNATLLVS